MIQAYASGKIKLPKPTKETGASRARHAPSFIQGKVVVRDEDRPYTAQTVAKFLGWLRPNGKAPDRIHEALAALEFIEQGILTEDAFEGRCLKFFEFFCSPTERNSM